MGRMYKRPEIIKRRRREITDSVDSSKSSTAPKESLPFEEASSLTAPSVDEAIESVEAPTPTEYWEAVEPPPPISPNSLSAWQPELREIAWEHQLDVWEDFLSD